MRVVFGFSPGTGIDKFQLGRSALLEAEGKSGDIGVESGMVPDSQFIAQRVIVSTEEIFCQGIEQDEAGCFVADDDGITDVFYDQIEAIAIQAYSLLGLAQFVVIFP